MATLEKIPESAKQEFYFLKRFKEKQHLRNQLLFFFFFFFQEVSQMIQMKAP